MNTTFKLPMANWLQTNLHHNMVTTRHSHHGNWSSPEGFADGVLETSQKILQHAINVQEGVATEQRLRRNARGTCRVETYLRCKSLS